MSEKLDKSKKRKRHGDEGSKRSKKVATNDDRKVEISLRKADEWAPVIGMFNFVILHGHDILPDYMIFLSL